RLRRTACSASSTRIATTRATSRSARGLRSSRKAVDYYQVFRRGLMVTRLFLATALAVLCVSGPAAAPSIRVVLVGDSTVTDDSGWGTGFKPLAGPDIDVQNTAANGRSSKSFLDEGRWRGAVALKGQYYLIQFGHNDEPGKGPERETDPKTTYFQNMARYVDEA